MKMKKISEGKLSLYFLLSLFAFGGSWLGAVDRAVAQTKKLDQLENTTKQLLVALKGYRECAGKGVCTDAQKRNLRRLAATIGALAVAAVIGTVFGKLRQRQQELAQIRRQAEASKQEKPAGERASFERRPGEEELWKAVDFKFLLAVTGNLLPHAKQLLEQGANVEALNPVGRTALSVAAVNRNKAMVELLLSWGARPQSVDQDVLRETSPEIRSMLTEE